MDERLVEMVLRAVDLIPRGRVAAYRRSRPHHRHRAAAGGCGDEPLRRRRDLGGG
ncbi:hypothetical protein [Nocardioides sp. B-3]|uniref:hypothetical protein n=1 Tax=Nocardioides sp. B-3 TaxID=2895565 RepID=UPI0021522A34|nr:hypothetical protein [Nocardioides sp. B-3]UUZ58388.1 hypothetical protein LP418_19640 [Nocardioides sp. B-3]